MKNEDNKKPGFEIDYNNFSNSNNIQKFTNKQLWATGSKFNTNNGSTVTESVKWGGQSRFLCGFNFYCATPAAHTISIVLNQETIIDKVPLMFFQPTINQRFLQYFEFIRPLSGSDTLVFSVASTASEAISYGVYMTRAYNRYYQRD